MSHTNATHFSHRASTSREQCQGKTSKKSQIKPLFKQLIIQPYQIRADCSHQCQISLKGKTYFFGRDRSTHTLKIFGMGNGETRKGGVGKDWLAQNKSSLVSHRMEHACKLKPKINTVNQKTAEPPDMKGHRIYLGLHGCVNGAGSTVNKMRNVTQITIEDQHFLWNK